jgi:hypothetical protein
MSSASRTELTVSSVPGTRGMPLSRITRLAMALSPTRAITSGLGPMNVIPLSAQISAKYGSSERNP